MKEVEEEDGQEEERRRSFQMEILIGNISFIVISSEGKNKQR